MKRTLKGLFALSLFSVYVIGVGAAYVFLLAVLR
jgi:hypothetical protein